MRLLSVTVEKSKSPVERSASKIASFHLNRKIETTTEAHSNHGLGNESNLLRIVTVWERSYALTGLKMHGCS